jgi:hypothetical protein
MIVMATMPTNAKVMRRDLIDPQCSVVRVIANLLLSAASSLELYFRSLPCSTLAQYRSTRCKAGFVERGGR